MSDYISNLSDPILVIILGLLAAQEVVHTCVLSKRWNNLWTSLPVLNINSRDSQAQYSMEGIIANVLEKITADVHLLELHLKCTLLELPVLPARLPKFDNLKVFTVSICTYSYLQMKTWIIKSCPNLTKLTIVQHENCYCDDLPWPVEYTVPPNPPCSSRLQPSPRRNLETVEIKYWRFDSIVWQVMKHLMLGRGELQNFRNYCIMNCYYDHTRTTMYEGTWSYSGWVWALVKDEAPGHATMHVEKSLLLYLLARYVQEYI